jgi:hypothetical protein
MVCEMKAPIGRAYFLTRHFHCLADLSSADIAIQEIITSASPRELHKMKEFKTPFPGINSTETSVVKI